MGGQPVRRISVPSVDTNVLLRWLLDDVPAQTVRAEALLASGQRLAVADAVLLEIVYVLERVMRMRRPVIASSFQVLFATASLDLDRSRWAAVIDEYLAHPKLSVTDIYLTALAHSTGATPLYTFDKKLAAQLNGAELA